MKLCEGSFTALLTSLMYCDSDHYPPLPPGERGAGGPAQDRRGARRGQGGGGQEAAGHQVTWTQYEHRY